MHRKRNYCFSNKYPERRQQLNYKQEETLKRAYIQLGEVDIGVKHSSMGSGSFDKTVVPVIENNSTYFFIRAQRAENLYNLIKKLPIKKPSPLALRNINRPQSNIPRLGGRKRIVR